jgi:flagellar motor switch protein FliG
MIILGDQVSSEILKQLDEEVQMIGREVARPFHYQRTGGVHSGRVPPDDGRPELRSSGRHRVPRKILFNVKLPGKEDPGPLMKSIGSETASSTRCRRPIRNNWRNSFTPSTRTIALVCRTSPLKPRVCCSLCRPNPADVALRMANLDQISPEIIAKIAHIIGQKLKALGEMSRESYGGVRAVAELFNRLDSVSSKDILDTIEVQDPNLAETIRHLMFVFEDILLIDQKASRNPRQDRPKGSHGGVERHQRSDQNALPAMHVAAWSRDAQGGHGCSRSGEDQGSRSGPAADHCGRTAA